jgi:hypothetical protein
LTTAELHKREIDEVAAAFFNAFSNPGGVPENIDALYDLFIREAIIVNNIGGATQVYDVRGFVEPRREILTNGSLTDFREWEVAEHTELFGNIAQRFSRYEKAWTASGRTFTGMGVKSLQFIRTHAGWKISALAWDDA